MDNTNNISVLGNRNESDFSLIDHCNRFETETSESHHFDILKQSNYHSLEDFQTELSKYKNNMSVLSLIVLRLRGNVSNFDVP